jgi:hypothetical protein
LPKNRAVFGEGREPFEKGNDPEIAFLHYAIKPI